MKNEYTVRVIKLTTIARINERIETFFGLRKVKMRNTTDNIKIIRKMMLIIFIIRGIIAAISTPFSSHVQSKCSVGKWLYVLWKLYPIQIRPSFGNIVLLSTRGV